MEKVKLPREVADAITKIKRLKENIGVIRSVEHDLTGDAVVVRQWCKEGRNNYDALLNSLVNGFEVEETPEDKVRELYSQYKDYEQKAREAIRETLNALGIKIEGVND